jgi:hypothetical protein
MKKSFSLAAFGLLAVASVAHADPLPPQIVPAPGTAVEVGGYHCLLTSALDQTAWCVNVGKVEMPKCMHPVIEWVPGTQRKVLACADGVALK